MAEKSTTVEKQGVGKNDKNASNGLSNPTKFGMAGIAVALFMLAFAFCEIITFNSAVFATVLTMGFIAPVIAGILEYVKGNSYRATSFVLFSLFFLTFFFFITGTIRGEYPSGNTIGIFFMAWTVVIFTILAGTVMKKMGMKMIMLLTILALFSLFTLFAGIAFFTDERVISIVAGALAFATVLAILVDFIKHICIRMKESKI
ncbi:MAG: GPR1/FUN34/YaaH family transporter [Firmicutes bacterium]|nr:GPR1/FUN34/YaaH family transporter [Bacillota bacterium]